jgi:hypothetical protein
MQTFFSNNMRPKKLTLKKHSFLILQSPIFSFLIFNFLGGGAFCHLCTVSLHFWNKHTILNFLYLIWPISREKIHLSEGLFSKFFDRRSKKCLIHLLHIQTYMKHSNFHKFCQNHWTHLCTYMHSTLALAFLFGYSSILHISGAFSLYARHFFLCFPCLAWWHMCQASISQQYW